ncbi:phycobilisome linker polypeptide [Leptolyngbya sp. PCC 6406]|uniref:phycobilisome linker polypeptide n=1 Tax=Leptolyngbya sp. PCC 6406 TaxID=1173264 RepID=UPI0002AC9C85|nr:phycobilisome linker polypeptide [Leptolyngbya sp. PCC 6406]
MSLMESRLGIGEVIDEKVELRQNWNEDDLQQVFRSAYTHVFGREGLALSEAFASAEALLRNGKINVRQFIEALAQSEYYKERFFYRNSQVRFIELNYKHLLGRAPYDQAEIAYHVDLYASQGYATEIASYFESSEYNNAFGDFIVPYYRGFQSIPGMKQVGFNRLFRLYRGNGSSDNAQGGGKNSRLRQQVALNLSNAIVPPSSSFSSLEFLTGLGMTPVRGDKRVFMVEVIQGASKTSVTVRRSRTMYAVPFDQLSTRYQEIHQRGGKIVRITPV